MRWSGDVAIITGRYSSLGDSTVMELWARARTGESVLLRVHGVKPWFEITPNGRWNESEESAEKVAGNLEQVLGHEEVREIEGPEMKLTDLGVKPVWKVFVGQPFLS